MAGSDTEESTDDRLDELLLGLHQIEQLTEHRPRRDLAAEDVAFTGLVADASLVPAVGHLTPPLLGRPNRHKSAVLGQDPVSGCAEGKPGAPAWECASVSPFVGASARRSSRA